MPLQLIDVIQMLDGRVSDGSDYQWKSFPNGHVLEFRNAQGEPFASCVFSKTTYNVYELCITRRNDAFRWVDPAYIDAYKEESRSYGFNPDTAWDNVTWQDTDYLHLAVLIKTINDRSKHERS